MAAFCIILLQEVCLSEAKAKALDDAAIMRKELQDQHEQQERVAAQVRPCEGRVQQLTGVLMLGL